MEVKKFKIRYRRLIVNRILSTAIFLILQILWFAFGIMKLTALFSVFDKILRLLSLFAVLNIVCKDGSPDYKICWIILILVVPIFGVLVYFFAGNKKPSKKMHRRINSTREKLLPQLKNYSRVHKNCEKGSAGYYISHSSGYPAYNDTDIKYYPVGEKMFEDMLREIKKAEKYIFIEYFIINEGHMWDSIMSLLIEKAQAGVDIRIIYDDMGCVGVLPPKYYKEIEKIHPNIKCMAFNPVVPVLSLVMNNRDHRKIMVIDGATAFSGGVNLSDEYINHTHPFGHWKDTGIMLKGTAALSFAEMFLEMWHTFRGNDDAPLLADYADTPQIGVRETKGYVCPFYDTPLDEEELSRNVYIDIIDRAKDYAYIFTPYLIPDESTKAALCLAAKRGVDVRIVTPGIPDKKVIYRLTRANYKPLLDAGVRIYEYTPGFIHAKSIVSDDIRGLVGTINLDFRSLFLHFECGTLFENCEAVEDLKLDSINVMEKSREITADNLKDYYRSTMLDPILRAISPLL